MLLEDHSLHGGALLATKSQNLEQNFYSYISVSSVSLEKLNLRIKSASPDRI